MTASGRHWATSSFFKILELVAVKLNPKFNQELQALFSGCSACSQFSPQAPGLRLSSALRKRSGTNFRTIGGGYRQPSLEQDHFLAGTIYSLTTVRASSTRGGLPVDHGWTHRSWEFSCKV